MQIEYSHKVYSSQNTLFGGLIGGSLVIASFLYLLLGKNIGLNPQLNNVLILLTIAGTFIGVRKFREDALSGTIKYGQALKSCMYMISVAAIIFGIYTFIIYRLNPELTTQYIETADATFREAYANSPMLESLSTMVRTFTTPYSIAFGETFNKIFSGFIFSLFLAGILRKTASV